MFTSEQSAATCHLLHSQSEDPSLISASLTQLVVLRCCSLQSATTQAQSQPVDYQAGMEAMVLAIWQQTNASLAAQQAQAVALQLEDANAHDTFASQSQQTQQYSAYLAQALAVNTNLSLVGKSSILHLSSTSSLLPVSQLTLLSPEFDCCSQGLCGCTPLLFWFVFSMCSQHVDLACESSMSC